MGGGGDKKDPFLLRPYNEEGRPLPSPRITRPFYDSMYNASKLWLGEEEEEINLISPRQGSKKLINRNRLANQKLFKPAT